MSNFAPKLEDSNDKELWRLINESHPSYSSLASDELTRRSIEKLNKSLDQAAEQSGRFTKAMFLIGLIQVLIAIFQLILSFAYTENIQLKILGVFLVLIVFIPLIILYRLGGR